MRSDEAINALKKDLLAQNWDIIYHKRDIDSVYETFITLFKSLYNKNCQIKEYNRKQIDTKCPWIRKGITKCLQNKNMHNTEVS